MGKLYPVHSSSDRTVGYRRIGSDSNYGMATMNLRQRMKIIDTIYTVAGIIAVSSILGMMIGGTIWLLT